MRAEDTKVEEDAHALEESRTISFQLFGSRSDLGSCKSKTFIDAEAVSKSESRSEYSSFDETDYSSVASSDFGMTTDDEGALPFLNQFVDSFCTCMDHVHDGGAGQRSLKNKEYRDTSLLYRSKMDKSSNPRGSIRENQYLKKFAHENKIKVPLENKIYGSKKLSNQNSGPMNRLRNFVQRNPRGRKGKKNKGSSRKNTNIRKKKRPGDGKSQQPKSRQGGQKLKNVDENDTFKSDQSPRSQETPKRSSKSSAVESPSRSAVDNSEDRSWKQKNMSFKKARSSPFTASKTSSGEFASGTKSF
mmetsp:Transcript_29734/g.43960  ORF Transcript_29734/g.43960 Transcript_29734/m.43960 type:complete len:302 (-) Transcript_29734:442-1347(-)